MFQFKASNVSIKIVGKIYINAPAAIARPIIGVIVFSFLLPKNPDVCLSNASSVTKNTRNDAAIACENISTELKSNVTVFN